MNIEFLKAISHAKLSLRVKITLVRMTSQKAAWINALSV